MVRARMYGPQRYSPGATATATTEDIVIHSTRCSGHLDLGVAIEYHLAREAIVGGPFLQHLLFGGRLRREIVHALQHLDLARQAIPNSSAVCHLQAAVTGADAANVAAARTLGARNSGGAHLGHAAVEFRLRALDGRAQDNTPLTFARVASNNVKERLRLHLAHDHGARNGDIDRRWGTPQSLHHLRWAELGASK